MEAMPFDGTGIAVAIDRDRVDLPTANQVAWHVMGKRPLPIAAFHGAARDLKVAEWERFRHNFLDVALSAAGSAAGLDWFDDERWSVIAGNFERVGWVIREGGLRGVVLDPEHYGYELFSFSEHYRRTGRSYQELREAARRRGRQVVAALGTFLTKPVVLCLFGHTLALSEARYGKTLQTGSYGLLPGFLDGILEGMPEGGVLIDGYEFAYGFKQAWQFVAAYRTIHRDGITFSAVPGDYRRKVRAGFGIRLDHQDRLDYFTPQELRVALESALAVSDGYVWLYSQKAVFFPPAGVSAAHLQAIEEAWRGGRR
jgi:hypothetical protein